MTKQMAGAIGDLPTRAKAVESNGVTGSASYTAESAASWQEAPIDQGERSGQVGKRPSTSSGR